MASFIRNLRHRKDGLAQQHPEQMQSTNHPLPSSPNHTASDLANRTFTYFYSLQNNQFQARVKSEGTLGENDHFGYTVWSVIIMVHAAAEVLSPTQLHKSIACLQSHWNPEKLGFCAWHMFPGNDDIYYDDNAHAAQALITAYQATHEPQYLAQAKSILTDLIIPSSNHGGIPWHTNDHSKLHACSTGPAAVTALRICLLSGPNQDPDPLLTRFAQEALLWLETNLQDPTDNLIWDRLSLEPDGSTQIDKTKWTYNTGFAIHGFTLLYELTHDEAYLAKAARLAESAMDPKNTLFDRTVPDEKERMYSDGSFFLHHLVDGYAALARHTRTEQLHREIVRIAQFGREYMYDPGDGLYFRGSRPYTISEELAARFNRRYGTNKGFERAADERDEKGELCKTLIGCAGWVRVLFAAEQVQRGGAL